MEWYPDSGMEPVQDGNSGRGLYFADVEGYIGWFENALPLRGEGGEGVRGEGVRGGGGEGV